MVQSCRNAVFIGCDYFGLRGFRELLALQSSSLRVVGVITGSDVASVGLRLLARSLGLPVCTSLPRDAATLPWLAALSPDIGVVMEYGHKIPASFLQQFGVGVVNFHPSELPEFRGGAPMESLITEQRPLVVSANIVSPKFDDGPILGRTEPFKIEGMELDLVYRLAAHLALPLLRRVVTGLLNGDCTGIPQNEARASYRWYKNLEQKLAISPEDTVAVCEKKLLASNPKHGIALHMPLIAGSDNIRVSAGIGLCCAHDYPLGSLVEATDEALTVAVKDGLMSFYQGTVQPGEPSNAWANLEKDEPVVLMQ